MTAKELMIGDWVFTRGQIEQVTLIYDGYICTENFSDSHDYYFDPIPLTPEILEKNGFLKIKSETTSLGETWAWHEKVTGRVFDRWAEITFYKRPINGVLHLTNIETCSEKGDGVDRIHSCDIDFIHELQHALRMCGIDKEIVV